jgi:hypothetical protein
VSLLDMKPWIKLAKILSQLMKLETHYSEHRNQLIRMYNAAEFSVGNWGLAFCTIYPH